MLFGGNGNGDPREFMYYQGKTYINGTTFTVRDDYIKNNIYNGKKIWKYARFWGTTNGPSGVCYYFSRDRCSYCDLVNLGYRSAEERRACDNDYAPYFTVRACDISKVIEDFIQPITLPDEQQIVVDKAIEEIISNPKKDLDCPELAVGWIIYIVSLIASLVFNEFYILWAIATYVFYMYRKNIIKQKQ